MSIYAQMVSSGIQLAGKIGQRDSATYNRVYGEMTNRRNALRAANRAERAIGEVKADRILTNINIQVNEMQARAAALTSAAYSGVQGGTLDQAIHEIESNAARRHGDTARGERQGIDEAMANIFAAKSAALSRTQVQKPSYLGSVAQAFSSFEMKDLEIFDAYRNRAKAAKPNAAQPYEGLNYNEAYV